MPEKARPKIELTLDDLNTPEVDARVEEMRTANEHPPFVQALGLGSTPLSAPSVRTGGWFRANSISLAFAGLLGGSLGWVLSEFIANPEAQEGQSLVWTAFWTGLVALGLGAVLSMWEGIQARSSKKSLNAARRALPVAVGGGAIGGIVAQTVYSNLVEDALRTALRQAIIEGKSADEVLPGLLNSVHIARSIGFGLLGACIGIALGVASGAKQRVINGAIGGAAAGLLGGWLFDYINLEIGGASRFVAMAVMGAVIGLAIGLVEAARKEFWIEIVSGGMAGKQFIVYHDSTSIGTAPDCHITLIKDPAISPTHLWLTRGTHGVTARAASAEPVTVNGLPLVEARLSDGDLVQLGQTLLRFGEKAPTVVMPGPLRA